MMQLSVSLSLERARGMQPCTLIHRASKEPQNWAKWPKARRDFQTVELNGNDPPEISLLFVAFLASGTSLFRTSTAMSLLFSQDSLTLHSARSRNLSSPKPLSEQQLSDDAHC